MKNTRFETAGAVERERERERERESLLTNRLTVGAAYHAAQDKITTYLPQTGLFVEKKIFLASNRVRDG